jgi:ATP-binding cassette, subfamily B (MDR/TAP), member 1
LAEDQA